MSDKSFLESHFTDYLGNLYKPEVISARLDWTEKDAYKDFSSPFFPQIKRQDPALYTNIGGGPLIDILKTLGEEDSVAAL